MKNFIGEFLLKNWSELVLFDYFFVSLLTAVLVYICGLLLLSVGISARNVDSSEASHDTEDNQIPLMLNPAYVSMTNALGPPVYSTFFNGIGYNVIAPGVVPVGLQPVGYVYNVAQYGGVPMTYSPYGIGCYQE